MRKLIGIISYLPDNREVRKNRIDKLRRLINKCSYLFRLPIYIVIQNWEKQDIEAISLLPYVTLSPNYDKLGIVGARKKLREYFISSDYDYLIMLDDDCDLNGGSGRDYLKQIDENPDCFIEFRGTLLKLFAISKTIFKEVDYENVNPENGEGFEDRIFVGKLRDKFPDRERRFKQPCGISENSISTRDPDSTWYKDQDLKTMIEKTTMIIGESKKNS